MTWLFASQPVSPGTGADFQRKENSILNGTCSSLSFLANSLHSRCAEGDQDRRRAMFIVSKLKVIHASQRKMVFVSRLIRVSQDTISVDAEDMEDDRGAVLKRVLNKKYANKVSSGRVSKKSSKVSQVSIEQIVPNIGLAIAVFDILDASEGMVLHADGCTYHKGSFPLLIIPC